MNKEKLYALHQMIKSKNTGTPKEAAEKLGISRATFFRYKSVLEDLGAEIVWAHCWGTYFYANDFDLSCPDLRIKVSVNGEEFHASI